MFVTRHFDDYWSAWRELQKRQDADAQADKTTWEKSLHRIEPGGYGHEYAVRSIPIYLAVEFPQLFPRKPLPF